MSKKINSEQLISDLLKLALEQYALAKQEIKVIYDECFEQPEDEFSIFEEVLLFSETIEGVAYRYTRSGISGVHYKLEKLKEQRLVNSPDFVFWFSTSCKKYRVYSLYITILESLRRILIEELELINSSEKKK